MARPLGVGIVGVEPGRSWASLTHVPALLTMPDRYSIVGVANRSPESSRRAAQALGLPDAFTSVADLVASNQVDVVAVTVKVPEHFAIVEAALAHGKHVYCEWPLGNGLADAEAMAALVLADAVLEKFGGDSVQETKRNFEQYMKHLEIK